MKKILLLVESLRINETSSGIVSSTFIKALYELKYDLTVITPRNFDYDITWFPNTIVVNRFDLPVIKKRFFDAIPKFRALPTYITGFSPAFRALINEWKAQIIKEINSKSYDYTYVLGSGSEFSPHFAVSELDIKIPVITNFHDPFPMHLYPAPYKKRKNLVNWIIERRTRKVISKSYKVSFPSQFLMEHMSKTFPEIKSKGFVVPHIGTELDNLPDKYDDKLVILQEDTINIVHAGLLLGPRNPKFLIQAILDLNDENPFFLKDVNFIFIGKITRELKDMVRGDMIKCITFYDFRISYFKSIKIIKESDCMLVLEAASDFSPFMPGKLADIGLNEKAIIALTPDNSEVLRILGKDYPYHANMDDVAGIKTAISCFLHDLKTGKIQEKSTRFLKEYVSVEKNAETLKVVLK